MVAGPSPRRRGAPSIHRAPWPDARDFAGIAPPADAGSFDAAVALLAAINKGKSEAGVSVGRGIRRLGLAANPATARRLGAVAADVMAAARVEELRSRAARPTLGDGVFEVRDGRLRGGDGGVSTATGATAAVWGEPLVARAHRLALAEDVGAATHHRARSRRTLRAAAGA